MKALRRKFPIDFARPKPAIISRVAFPWPDSPSKPKADATRLDSTPAEYKKRQKKVFMRLQFIEEIIQPTRSVARLLLPLKLSLCKFSSSLRGYPDESRIIVMWHYTKAEEITKIWAVLTALGKNIVATIWGRLPPHHRWQVVKAFVLKDNRVVIEAPCSDFTRVYWHSLAFVFVFGLINRLRPFRLQLALLNEATERSLTTPSDSLSDIVCALRGADLDWMHIFTRWGFRLRLIKKNYFCELIKSSRNVNVLRCWLSCD